MTEFTVLLPSQSNYGVSNRLVTAADLCAKRIDQVKTKAFYAELKAKLPKEKIVPPKPTTQFGVPLDVAVSGESGYQGIPNVIYRSCVFLDEHGLDIEGNPNLNPNPNPNPNPNWIGYRRTVEGTRGQPSRERVSTEV